MSGCCGVEPINKQLTDADKSESTRVELAVFGMGCGSCANRVSNSLLQLSGVIEASVNHLSGLAQVVYDPNKTNINELLFAVVEAGGDGQHNYSARLLPREVKQ